MDLKIENIGIVETSTIKIDGLTVLTGHNNSGKSTVGKVLFSLINSISDIEKKYSNDKKIFYMSALERMLASFEVPSYLLRSNEKQDDTVFSKFINFKLYETSSMTPLEMEAFFYQLTQELEGDAFEQYLNSRLIESNALFSSRLARIDPSSFYEKRKKALEISYWATKEIDSDPYLIRYTRKSIERSLLEEFKSQIQPINFPNMTSKIELTSDASPYFSMKIEANQIVVQDEPVYYASPFKSVVFIDDTSAIDSLEESARRVGMYHDNLNEEVSINSRRALGHNIQLTSLLRRLSNMTILEEESNSKRISSIQNIFNTLIPGDIAMFEKGIYYIHNGFRLRPSNLAAGSKLLSIIKTLITRGAIEEDTLLIIDEPEAHLHPEWQNIFAEIIALLIKEIGVTVLVTTHSPNFMLAIETNVKKYNITDNCNFYQAVQNSAGRITHKCVNEDLAAIYYDFTQYFSSIKAERDAYNFLAEED